MKDKELIEAVVKVLERETTPDSRMWSADERGEYERAGGWSAGRDAVRKLRAQKIIAIVRANSQVT